MSISKKIVIAALATSVSAGAISTAFAQDAQPEAGAMEVAGFAGDLKRGGGPRGERFFERFDANGDSVVDLEELTAASADKFSNMDEDGDGSVDLAEFKTGFEAETKPAQVRTFQRIDVDGDGTVTQAEYDAFAGRVFDMYEKGPRGFGGKKGFGPRHDMRDGDRDRGDHGHHGKWAKNEKRGDGPRGERFERRGDGDHRPDMGRNGMRGMHHGGMKGPFGFLLAQFDADKDGKVSRGEFDAKSAELFALADTNQSGDFTLEDFSSIWMSLNDTQAVRKFQAMDANGDLAITADEQEQHAGMMLERMDRNDDGLITKADFERGKRGFGKNGPGKWRKHG